MNKKQLSMNSLSSFIYQQEKEQRLQRALENSAALHRHLCPRQILGVRIGFAGADMLGIEVPRSDKKMLVIVETDGCFISGIQTATGVGVNYRTLRVVDYGKVAATFVNIVSGEAIRIFPHPDVRQTAWDFAPPGETRRYYAMLYGYQVMPLEKLLFFEQVQLKTKVTTLISRPGVRVDCSQCGEEILNEREIVIQGQFFCAACAYDKYYVCSNK